MKLELPLLLLLDPVLHAGEGTFDPGDQLVQVFHESLLGIAVESGPIDDRPGAPSVACHRPGTGTLLGIPGRTSPCHSPPGLRTLCLQRIGYNLPRLADDGLEVRLVLEALRVDLVNILSAGRPGREPTTGRDHLQPADRRVVARRAG